MNLRRLTATAVLVIAALGVGAGTSFAQPTPATPQNITYETKLVDKTIESTLKGGVFKVKDDGKTVDIKDMAGKTVINFPLAVNVNAVSVPLAHQVKNNGATLELTPQLANLKLDTPRLVKPVASLEENQKAMTTFATQFGIATAIGGFAGTAIGAILGGLAGFAINAAICVAPPFVQCLLTALPVIALGASIGAIIGTIAIGGPALGIASVDLIQTLIAPPGTTKWYNPKTDAH